MYFATNSARIFSIKDDPEVVKYEVLGICANVRKTHFCVLTESDIAVWKVRVSGTRCIVNQV